MTLLAWYGPWEWPAWPAFAVKDVIFGTGSGYLELPNAGRGAVIVGLIAVNVAFWGLLTRILWIPLSAKRTKGVPRS